MLGTVQVNQRSQYNVIKCMLYIYILKVFIVNTYFKYSAFHCFLVLFNMDVSDSDYNFINSYK